MNAPLALYLTRFADVEPVPALTFAPELPESFALSPEDDFEDRLATIREEVMAEAEAATASQLLTLNTAHQAALTDALAEARARWVADEGATHAALLGQAFADLRENLSRRVAIALKPLLIAALVERAQTAICDALDHIVADPEHPVVTVRGPTDLIEGIRAARSETEGLERVSYVKSAGVEIVVDAAGTHVETRLAAALATIQEI